jgi:conjugal transfer pilin signal peptidase TrbI
VEKNVLPKRGELAMILSHETELMPAGVKIIKIVAGEDGDRILVDKYKVTSGRTVYYAPIEEAASFLSKPINELTGSFLVPENSYYMIGTFAGSYDSRFFGPVHKKQVVGRAYLII